MESLILLPENGSCDLQFHYLICSLIDATDPNVLKVAARSEEIRVASSTENLHCSICSVPCRVGCEELSFCDDSISYRSDFRITWISVIFAFEICCFVD